jgi:UDP-GlcNAc:undecaprenyl-phosphate GlcNAc-1-phosphate transferase
MATWPYDKWFLLLAVFLGVVFGKACMQLALRWHWVDRPGHRKSHKRPVPYLGGLAVFLALTVTVATLTFFFRLNGSPGFSLASLLVVLAPALAVSALGLWDDLWDLRARHKFLGQAIVALLFSHFAYRFSALHIPGLPPLLLDPLLATALTAFFMLAVVNGFNMIDGSDALCLGVSSCSMLTLAVLAQWHGQPHLVALALSAAGACLGVLYWNKPPAKMYGGDAGSQGLGFLTAGLILAVGQGEPGRFVVGAALEQRQPYPYQFVVACLVVGVPALEVLLTVLRRGLQGRALGRADQGHLHHRLSRLGLSPLGIAVVAVLANLWGAAIVLAALQGARGLVLQLSVGLVVLSVFGLQKLGYTRFFQRRWLDDRRPHFAAAHHFNHLQCTKLLLAQHREEALALVAQTCHEFGARECRVTLSDQSGRWTWTWVEPLPRAVPERLRGKPLPSERVRLPGTRNHASWTMENDDREAELNMNARVLMVEFMGQALKRLVELAPEPVEERPANTLVFGQKELVLSIQGYKRRLQARAVKPNPAYDKRSAARS